MSHKTSRINRVQLASAANAGTHLVRGHVTLSWRGRKGPRSTSLSYLALGSTLALGLGLSVWGVAVTSYLAFKDDIVSSLLHRQAAVQAAYEDRIRDLKAQVDRLTSRQMVDQTELERRVDQVARRQAILETRQSILTALKEASGLGTTRAAAGAGPAAPSSRPGGPAPAGRPTPLGDTVRLTPPERHSRLESRPAVAEAAAPRPFALAAAPGRREALSRVEFSLDEVEQRQQAALQALEGRAERRARRIRTVLAELGLDQARLAPPRAASTAGGTGGPLIPLPDPRPDASPFERQVFRIHAAIRDQDRLNRLVETIPLGRPNNGDLELSSSFGARLDPFLRTWAMHSGIDFRGATGDPVFATAAGRVSHASAAGGYGLMVEIDHGNGLTTRYAHLSRIEVSVGDMIRLGQRVGRVGSTGRSTGPHLHYETRVNGEAVDPMRFVRAGVRLARAD